MEGFHHLSNAKSVMVKPALDMKPFNDLLPPFDARKQKQLKPMAKLIGFKTQASVGKCVGLFGVALVVLVLLLTGFLGSVIGRTGVFTQLMGEAFMKAFLN